MFIYNIIRLKLFKKSIVIFLPKQDFNEHEYLETRHRFIKSGFQVFIASDTVGLCIGSNGLKVSSEISLFNITPSNFCGIVLIGGNGVREYWNSKPLHSVLKKFSSSQKVIGAICAAPVVLAKTGILISLEATCFAGDSKELTIGGAILKDSPVVVSENIVTSNSEENTTEFANAVISLISSKLK